jgi:hypothetical protein
MLFKSWILWFLFKLCKAELIVSRSTDDLIRIYNVSSSQTVLEIESPLKVNSIQSLDKFHLALLGNERFITIWNLKTKTIHGLLSHKQTALVLEVFNQSVFASGAKDNMVILWNWQTLSQIKQFNHMEHVQSLLKINDTVLASGGFTIKLWEVNTGNLLLQIPGHSTSHLVFIMLKIDTDRIISFAYNNTRVWSIQDGTSLASLDVNSFNGSSWFGSLVKLDQKRVALGTIGEFDRLIIWEMGNYNVTHNVSTNGNVSTLIKLLDGRLATRNCCGCFLIFNVTRSDFEKFCQAGNDNVAVLKQLPDGSILSGSSEGYLTRNFLSSNKSQILLKHNASISHIEILSSKDKLKKKPSLIYLFNV